MNLSDGLGCIICRKPLQHYSSSDNQPVNGLEFTAYGHYGSTAFDPMDSTHLVINICDPCLVMAKNDGFVYHYDPSREKPLDKWIDNEVSLPSVQD